MSKIYDQFKNPGAYYRGKPFWSWNGKLEEKELLRQVDVLKEMGFGGYFMHSRTGLVTEYLGKEWFELINAVADHGKKEGMESWLYDEDRWPSGSAGGYATEDRANAMKFIRLKMFKGSEYEFDKEHFITFACDMLPEKHEFAFENDFVITQDTPKKDYENKTVLAFSIERMYDDSFYNGNTYLDTMSPEAVGKFIELTHEKYDENCGDRFGTAIPGIFTDEPHRGAVMCAFSVPNPDAFYLTPYTPKLFEKFTEKFGYDLKAKLPDLFLLRNGEMVSQIKWHYMDLIEQLFIDAFAKPINDWCNERGMKLTGHVLHEDSFTTQACMIGSIMRFYEYMGTPGVDVLSEYNRGYWIVKQLASVGRQMGKAQLLSELYGCSGWQMDFESHKWTGGWQTLFGVNLRCHHLSWYSMQGEAKRDYPASINHQSAWYKDYHVVEDYFSRLNVVLEGEPVCDTLVVNPVESTFGMIYPGWSHSLGTAHPEIARLEGMYFDQFHWLSQAKLDFDYGDEEMMSRHCSVIIENGTPYVKFGNMKYKKVLVSGMRLMRSSTLALLKEFSKAGGIVIVAGEGPDYIDALKSDEFKSASADFTCVNFDKASIVSALTANEKRLVVVNTAMGDELDDVFCQIRRDDEGYFIVLMNMNKEFNYLNCEVVLNFDGDCEEWFPYDATRAFIKSSENGVIRITTDFYGSGEHVYRIVKKSELEPIKVYTPISSFPLGEEFDIELDEPNVLVLDLATAYVNGEEVCKDEVLKADMHVRNKFGLSPRHGSMVQPWFIGLKENKKHGRVAMEYEFFAEHIPETFFFVCETPDLWDTITVNGNPIDRSKETDRWIDEAFHRFDLDGKMLTNGKNVVRMECDFYETLNIEAVYILGDFGVRIDNSDRTIIPPVRRIIHGDIVNLGLPFYSGRISYKTSLGYNTNCGSRVIVSLPDFEAAVVNIVVNDSGSKPIAWRPYEADITDLLKDGDNQIKIEYVLTRRNTFGPLHAYPARWGAYGPGNFTTGGNDWTYNYVFVPAGMTAVPMIINKK